MARKTHGYTHLSREVRQKAGSSGGRRRHGDSIVWIDGVPVSLQRTAAECGFTLEQLSARVGRMKAKGQPITEAALRAPFLSARFRSA